MGGDFLKTYKFESIEEFCEEVNDTIEDMDEHQIVAVVAKYEDASEIIRELVYYDYTLKEIDLSSPENSEYDDEYEVRVCDGEIFCERMKRNCQYILSGADVVYFMENVNSRVVRSYPDASNKYVVEIGEDPEDEYDCCYCGDGIKVIKDDDGDVHGFTFSKSDDNGYSSYSFYSSDDTTVYDFVKELAKIWDILE